MKEKQASIVLGLQFGDEGKGRTVDQILNQEVSEDENPLVIRFSGGQQAGHTVVVGDVRHVFSTFGSGTLRGVPTYISKHCTFYLNSMAKEYDVLHSKGIIPSLMVDPLTMLTTPYDIVYNRRSERIRKNGSCGMGVGATMARNEKSPYKLYAIDLFNLPMLTEKLLSIHQYYKSTMRIVMLHTDEEVEDEKWLDAEMAKFLEIAGMWRAYFEITSKINGYDHYIFEGSQGILLDMDHGVFPNVTYANTTSKNALEICDKLEIKTSNTHTYYVTRTYKTRHGNGWYGDETPVDLINNDNETNVYNPWQGDFKTAKLDVKLLDHAFNIDRIYNSSKYTMVINCMDQHTLSEEEREDMGMIKLFHGDLWVNGRDRN